MRILAITDQWFPDLKGGLARVARQTAAGLAERGNEVEVLAPKVRAEPGDDPERVAVHREIRRWAAVPETWTNPRQVARALRRLGVDRFDVVLAHSAAGVIGAAHASELPIAYVFHASVAREMRYRRRAGISGLERARSRAVEPALARQEREAARRAGAVLVLSEFSRGLFEEAHPDEAAKVSVVGAGTDTTRFSPASDRSRLREELGIDPGERVVLTVRRLVPRMGLEMLIDAVASLARGRDPVRLVVIGDGELRSSLERRAHDLAMPTRVAFLGSVEDSIVLDWYRAADVFVLPTLAYEGFGMATVEALACGTPVVGTSVGATPELLNPLDPELVSEPNPRALGAAISRCLQEASPAELRDACRGHAVEHHSWDHGLERWEAALAVAARSGSG